MEFEFDNLGDDELFSAFTDVAIGKTRPSETVRSWNDTELKSIISGTELGNHDHGAVVALCEGRGNLSEIGFIAYDLHGNCCYMLQYADLSNYSRTMRLLNIYCPMRILICSSASENHRSKLYEALLDVYSLDSICFMNRSDFREDCGKRAIERLGMRNDIESILFGFSKKYYALSAASALFHFLEQEMGLLFSSGTLKFQIVPSDGILSLDYHTCKSLELLDGNEGSKFSKKRLTLLGVLCKCQTKMGKRLFRMNMLQPLSDCGEISARQDAIQLLLEHELEFQELEELLKNFPDLDNLISKLVRADNLLDPKSGEEMIHRILMLKVMMRKAKSLSRCLETLNSRGQCDYLQTVANALSAEGLDEIWRLIEEIIDEDVIYSGKTNVQHYQRLFAVKASRGDSLLEVARRTMKELQADIYEYVEVWSQQIGLPVDIRYQSKRGYYMSVKMKALGERSIEEICTHFKRGKNEVTFTTMDLIKLNGRVRESMSEVLLASQSVLVAFFDRVRQDLMGVLYDMSAAVAKLDYLWSLVQWALSSGGPVSRPEITDSTSLTVRQGRHPVLESTTNLRYSVVANDYFSCRGNSFIIVTGANMSGKSTYTKQLALLAIMMQMGSFVPAEFASMPCYERILTRIGSDDELESNCSSFRMEMKESAYLLEMINDKSLVIIDELGRGTGFTEGLSVAISICDYILEKSSATVYFVTHFDQLVEYLKFHPKVSLIQLRAEISEISKELRYFYQATAGRVSIDNYGMRLAEKVGLPEKMIESTWRALEALKRNDEESSGIRSVLSRRRLILQTADKIKFVQNSEKIPEDAKKGMLIKIKSEFENQLEGVQ